MQAIINLTVTLNSFFLGEGGLNLTEQEIAQFPQIIVKASEHPEYGISINSAVWSGDFDAQDEYEEFEPLASIEGGTELTEAQSRSVLHNKSIASWIQEFVESHVRDSRYTGL